MYGDMYYPCWLCWMTRASSCHISQHFDHRGSIALFGGQTPGFYRAIAS
jgi:hypothetical protein